MTLITLCLSMLKFFSSLQSHNKSFSLFFCSHSLRGRLKSKKSTGLPSSSLEMYLNHQVRTNTANGNSSRSSTSSPPQHGLPPALSNSSNNQPKSAGLAVDLNDKGKLHRSSLPVSWLEIGITSLCNF